VDAFVAFKKKHECKRYSEASIGNGTDAIMKLLPAIDLLSNYMIKTA
jgi:hypothetical protein